MLRALIKLDFTSPTEVQEKAIPPMLAGNDLLVQAPTGTGKTAAFSIPIIEGIDPALKAIQCLIICPTRELAIQTQTVVRDLTAYKHGIRTLALYGGEPIQRQISALKGRPQIIVATPGRLIDHINRRTAKLKNVNKIVLDEADRMLDMGFRDDIYKIFQSVESAEQVTLFSATLSPEIETIAATYQKDPIKIVVEQETKTVDTVTQYYTVVPQKLKTTALTTLLEDKDFQSPIIFVATKSMAHSLAQKLSKGGYSADSLHGDLRQGQRNRVMKAFRKRKIKALVATDVAARGLDVDGVDAVINFDIPTDVDSYIHRIGRTGRAQSSGSAYTIIAPREREQIQNIMSTTKSTIVPLKVLAGNFEDESPKKNSTRKRNSKKYDKPGNYRKRRNPRKKENSHRAKPQ